MTRVGAILITVLSTVTQLAIAGPLINVGTWNVANRPNDDTQRAAFRTVLDTLDLDVLVLVETDTESANEVAELLGAEVILSSADPGGDRLAVLWQPTLQLLDSRELAGIDGPHPRGRAEFFLTGLVLVLVIASFSYRFTGFPKTISLLLGMLLGTAVFFILDFPGLNNLTAAEWLSMPGDWVPSAPAFYWPAVTAMAASYVAALVNSLGSLHGIANITDRERLPRAVTRGIMLNGVEGVCCGLMGIVGMVSYSLSPGVVLANRVASRYAVALCGAVLALAAFVPKLAALLALVPAPVVASALLVAMGTQVGAALSIISSAGMSGRDYFVVGIPVMLGTLTAFLPADFTATLPPSVRLFAGNGLIVGIFLVLLLEHVLMRKK
jgi:uracil permease